MTWIPLLALLAVGVYILMKVLGGSFSGEKLPPAPVREVQTAPDEDELQETAPAPAGPPSAGMGLDAIRAAIPSLDDETLANILDSGAALKEGVGDLVEKEISRRKEESG